MIDAYTHLDMTAQDPLEDFRHRMVSAGVDRALVVETWSGSNFTCLEHVVKGAFPEFRVAPCFRPDAGLPSPGLLGESAVCGLRVKTGDVARLRQFGGLLQSANKWLVVHAEAGIAPLVEELISLRKQHPQLPIYVPHLGWPRREGVDDASWGESIVALSRMRGVVVGISAIAHFSREPFPHHDVAAFASRVLQLFRPQEVVAGSDYPLFEKSRYAEYMGLAIEWVNRTSELRSSLIESTFFQGQGD